MSTGDQSQYIRSKMAERGSRTGAKFMMDGFDRWSESTAPARIGQMEKIPSEHKMEGYGGAMSLQLARKKLGMNLHDGMEVHGGAIPSVNDLVDVVKKLLSFWRSASQWIDEFDQELTDEIIENPKITNQTLKNVAKTLKDKLMLIKTAKSVLDQIASLAQSVGLGRKRKMGGASLSDIAELAKKYGEPIVSAYMWLKNNKPQVEAIMKMRSLQPLGQKVLDAVNPILGAVGLGRRGKHCQCSDSESMCGGAEFDASEYSDPMMGGSGIWASQRNMGGVAPMDIGAIARATGPKTKKQELDGALHNLGFRSGGRRHGGVAPMDIGAIARATGPKTKKQELDGALHNLGFRSGGFMPNMFEEMQRMSQPQKELVYRQKELVHGGRVVGGRKPSARGAIVKKVMAQHGLSLPQASKYVKEHGLY